jgi:predicted ArsR family transcriptional regulator
MRATGVWMCQADERILERLDESDVGTAWKIAYDLDCRVSHVRRRCLVLADTDFVDVVQWKDRGDQYAITDAGRGYLLGEYDADLRRPTPGPRPPEAIRPITWRGEV